MDALHQKLRLQHHRHTGRRLHHKHTSYHGLAVVFVLAGVLMLTVTALGRATADDFSVGGTVKAPVPSSPAIITSLSDGSHVTSDSQLIAGSCPIITPQVVVAVTVDKMTVGSAVCDSSNNFSFPVRLSQGAHTIVAGATTITDDAGPLSEPLHVTYTPGGTKAIGSVTSQPNGPVATPNPLIIHPKSTLLWLGDNKTATWAGALSGGTPPYKVVIEWGDGTRQVLDKEAGETNFDHAYGTLQPYNMSLSITDATHTALHEQFAVASFATSAAALATTDNTTTNQTPLFANSSEVLGLYGLYLTAIAVVGIVWLEAKHAAKEFAHAP